MKSNLVPFFLTNEGGYHQFQLNGFSEGDALDIPSDLFLLEQYYITIPQSKSFILLIEKRNINNLLLCCTIYAPIPTSRQRRHGDYIGIGVLMNNCKVRGDVLYDFLMEALSYATSQLSNSSVRADRLEWGPLRELWRQCLGATYPTTLSAENAVASRSGALGIRLSDSDRSNVGAIIESGLNATIRDDYRKIFLIPNDDIEQAIIYSNQMKVVSASDFAQIRNIDTRARGVGERSRQVEAAVVTTNSAPGKAKRETRQMVERQFDDSNGSYELGILRSRIDKLDMRSSEAMYLLKSAKSRQNIFTFAIVITYISVLFVAIAGYSIHREDDQAGESIRMTIAEIEKRVVVNPPIAEYGPEKGMSQPPVSPGANATAPEAAFRGSGDGNAGPRGPSDNASSNSMSVSQSVATVLSDLDELKRLCTAGTGTRCTQPILAKIEQFERDLKATQDKHN